MSKKDWQLLKAYQATGLTPEEVERVKRERKELRNDLKKYTGCVSCAYDCINRKRCDICENKENCHCQDCFFGTEWQWRGVKEDKQ